MAMNKIDGSSIVQPNVLNAFKKDAASEGTERGKRTESGQTEHRVSDRAEISENGRKMVDLRAAVDVGRAAYDATPDVRNDKVALAKERIDSGFYESPEVKDKTAAQLSKTIKDMDAL